MAPFSIASTIREIEREIGTLSPMQKILLGTDGSVTAILENVLGCRVEVATLLQEIVPADRSVAADLDIPEGEEVNHRIVTLNNGDTGETLMYAVSNTPLSRLDPAFRQDLMRADIPIGRIMQMHRIEARRELKEAGVVVADRELSRIFGIYRHEPLLSRKYQIINRGKPLIAINETFPYGTFADDTRVIVEAPARIHMTLIDMNGSSGRVDGGIGISLEEPTIVLEARRSEEVSVRGDHESAETVKKTAEQVLMAMGVDAGAEITLRHTYPRHAGLGSGTQLALATARALAELYRRPAPDGTPLSTREIAALAGRGGTSGIGTAAFESGGFVLDGGHSFGPSGEKTDFRPSAASRGIRPAPVVLRHAFPTDWQILLATPKVGAGVSGQQEKEIFRDHCPVPLGEVQALCHTILMQMLPGIVDHDLDLFGSAVNTIQEIGFKRVEHSLQPPKTQELIAALRNTDAACVGLSSFGPTVYAIGDTGMTAVQRAAEEVMGEGGGVTALTCARNRGAEIRTA